MNAIFADTGYWIALFNPRDDLHDKALTVARVTQDRPIVTSQHAQRPDKEWSLVDCASFLIMQERNLKEALAHDEHFQQAGFVPLLRDN